MSKKLTKFALLLGATSIASPAAGQETPVNFELKGTPDAATATGDTTSVPIPPTGNLLLRIHCETPFDCTKVTVGGEAEAHVTEKGTATKVLREFVMEGGVSAVESRGQILHDGQPTGVELHFTLSARTGGGGSGGGPTLVQEVPLWLATQCQYTPGMQDQPYANIVMNPFGQVLYRSPSRYNDEDVVTVTVLADHRVTHLLDIKMASDLAQPVVTNIYGADQQPFNRQSLRGDPAVAPERRCSFTAAEPLGPFASPKGVVKVTVYDGASVKDLGSAEFVVAPMYTGTFTLGGISTALESPTFAKAFNGQDTVIVRRDDGRRILYTAMYTHFWRKRDLSRPLPANRLYEAITPMVGVVLNDVTSNALIGASVELRPGFAFVAGWHLGRVTVLDESTGAGEGGEWENRGDVPTENEWKDGGFFGLSIDVRAAGALLQSLLGGGSGS